MAQKEDGKGLQKSGKRTQKRAVQKGENVDKWKVNKRKEMMQIKGIKG